MDDLQSLRVALGWSQGQMASFLNYRQPTVQRIEGGQALSGPATRLVARLRVLVAERQALPGMSVDAVVAIAISGPAKPLVAESSVAKPSLLCPASA